MPPVKDPVRLLAPGSNVSPELRTSLQALRTSLPSAPQLESLAARLTLAGAPVTFSRSGVVPKTKLNGTYVAASKMATIAAAAGGVALAIYLTRGGGSSMSDSSRPSTLAPAFSPATGPVATGASVPRSQAGSALSESGLAQQAPQANLAAAAGSAQPSGGMRVNAVVPAESSTPDFAGAAPHASSNGGGGQWRTGVTTPLTPEVAGADARSNATTQRQAAARRAGGVAPEAEAEADLSEAELLRRARAALGSAPGQTLELAEHHRRRFPAGVMGQEREFLAIAALVRLGSTSAAEARGSAFRRAFPGSPYERQLRRLLPEVFVDP